MDSSLAVPVLVGLFFAFAPGVCVLVLYAVGRVQANVHDIERIEAGERRVQAIMDARRERTR